MDDPRPTGGLGLRPPDPLVIAGQSFTSRLVMGTGGAASLEALEQALAASGTEMTTVALRRTSPQARGSILDVLRRVGCRLLPNTAGCFTARDAASRSLRAAPSRTRRTSAPSDPPRDPHPARSARPSGWRGWPSGSRVPSAGREERSGTPSAGVEASA